MIILSLLDQILRLFGTNRQQLRWRYHRWQQKREVDRERRANLNKHITYKHKVCETCGQIVDRSARVCPHCKQPVASWGAKLTEKVANRLAIGPGSMTSGLLVSNGAIYLLIVLSTGSLWSVDTYTAINYGANYGPMMTAGGEWWRLITANFLHVGGLIHVAFNLIALAMIGPMVEEWYGTARAFIIYALSGVLSAVASHVWLPLAVSGGASGAVLGLIGAGVIAGHLDGTSMGRAMRNALLRWFAYIVVFGLLVKGIDNAAHFGGFFAGVVLGAGFQRGARDSLRRRWLYRGIAMGLVALCVVSFVLAFASSRGYPAVVSDVDIQRAQATCLEARRQGSAEQAVEPCERWARFDWYSDPNATNTLYQLYMQTGRRVAAARTLAIFAATYGIPSSALTP